jgi:hypothetical protein
MGGTIIGPLPDVDVAVAVTTEAQLQKPQLYEAAARQQLEILRSPWARSSAETKPSAAAEPTRAQAA